VLCSDAALFNTILLRIHQAFEGYVPDYLPDRRKTARRLESNTEQEEDSQPNFFFFCFITIKPRVE